MADNTAHKNYNLLKRDFTAQATCEKLVGDITQLQTADGNLYISGVFDCFDNARLRLSMDNNMKTLLVVRSLVRPIISMELPVLFFTPTGAANIPAPISDLACKSLVWCKA